MRKLICATCLVLIGTTLLAAEATPSDVDYAGFLKLTGEVQKHRSERLVPLDRFLELANEPDTLILDTRSEADYLLKHINGAIHLNFSEFGSQKLSRLIPSKDTVVLIYCNNNFKDDPKYFFRKSPPLALNIPTFVNLYGYGYRNVFELSELVSIKDSRLSLEGTSIR